MRKLKLHELDRVDVETYKSLPKLPVVIVLDNIRSAHNVGSFFRTADGFGLEKIILTGITARPPHKEINKAAIGATSSVEWSYSESVSEAIHELKSQDYKIIGVEQTDLSIPLNEVEIASDDKFVLVFGNEVSGLSEEILPLLDQAIEIPQYGTKHSFNVAVCGGMVLWEISRLMRG